MTILQVKSEITLTFQKTLDALEEKKAKMREIVLPERDLKLRIKRVWGKAGE